MQRADEMPAVPRWFVQSLGIMFAGYPQTPMPQLAPMSYWRSLCELPREAVERAMDRACEASPQWVPTAHLVRDHARAIAKTLGPKPDLSRPALPEHDDCDDLDPETQARFDEAKRLTGDERRRELARIFAELVERL